MSRCDSVGAASATGAGRPSSVDSATSGGRAGAPLSEVLTGAPPASPVGAALASPWDAALASPDDVAPSLEGAAPASD